MPLRPFCAFSIEGVTRISVGGRFAPRNLLFGLDVKAAQSNGEYPGSRTARFEELDGLVTFVGASVLLERPLLGGARREAAAEGGGRNELELVVLFGRGGYRPGAREGAEVVCDAIGRRRGGAGGGIREELFAGFDCCGGGGGGIRVLSAIFV